MTINLEIHKKRKSLFEDETFMEDNEHNTNNNNNNLIISKGDSGQISGNPVIKKGQESIKCCS